MEQNKICPLLTTNTVVDENNIVKIGKEMEGVNAGILCSLGIAAPMVDGEPVDNSVTVERNLYKHLYEDLLNKVMAR